MAPSLHVFLILFCKRLSTIPCVLHAPVISPLLISAQIMKLLVTQFPLISPFGATVPISSTPPPGVFLPHAHTKLIFWFLHSRREHKKVLCSRPQRQKPILIKIQFKI
jgi:hypothetical protein